MRNRKENNYCHIIAIACITTTNFSNNYYQIQHIFSQMFKKIKSKRKTQTANGDFSRNSC